MLLPPHEVELLLLAGVRACCVCSCVRMCVFVCVRACGVLVCVRVSVHVCA